MFLPIYRNDSRPRNSQDYHIYFIVYVFFATLPGTQPHQLGVQVAARIQGPDHSDAVASRRGYAFEIHHILRASRGPVSLFPSPRSGDRRRHRGPPPSGALQRRTRAPSRLRPQRPRTGRGVLIEPVTLLHDQQYYVQALALVQRDRVSPTLLPRLLLAQAGDLGGQIEALQCSVQGPLGLWVRPRSHTLSSLELGHLIVISQDCHYRTSN